MARKIREQFSSPLMHPEVWRREPFISREKYCVPGFRKCFRAIPFGNLFPPGESRAYRLQMRALTNAREYVKSNGPNGRRVSGIELDDRNPRIIAFDSFSIGEYFGPAFVV